jgi:multidrug resistance efflux pump
MSNTKRILATGAIVLVAVVAVLIAYWDYVVHPWTRDGQVRANVIQIAPRVSGPVVELPIVDNQFVRAGEVLLRIDPRTFEVALEQARAQLANTSNNYTALSEQVVAAQASVEAAKFSIQQAAAAIKEAESTLANNKAEFDRQKEMLPRKATSQKAYQQAQANYLVSVQQRATAIAGLAQSKANLHKAEANLAEARANRGAADEKNPQVRAALADLEQAELDLEFATIRAPVDGYVTNLNIRVGSQMVANQPALALVDVNSYWITGYFRENTIRDIQPGDRAVVTLMSYPGQPLAGRVKSLGWGIAQQDGSTGFQLLPNVAPTFEWIRLAQRIPVLVDLDEVPDDIALRVGTTCSVLVETGTADQESDGPVRAAPRALQ